MGKSCCVPNCKSNYRNSKEGHVSVFKFPNEEEMKQKWVRAIHRENFTPTKTSVVCIKHFVESHIIRNDTMTRDDGTVLIVPRCYPKLSKDAVPTQFPLQPSYMSVTVPLKRKHPDERRAEVYQRDDEQFCKWLQDDQITCFDVFLLTYKTKSLKNFLYKDFNNSAVWFYLLHVTETFIKVSVSFKVSDDLKVQIFYGDCEASPKKFEWLLGKNSICDKWSIFDSLISHLSTLVIPPIEPQINEKMERVSKHLTDCIEQLSHHDESTEPFSNSNKLVFLKEQLDLTIASKPFYSPETFIWACSMFLQFPAAYNLLRKSDVLTLPHPFYIRRVTANIKDEIGLKPAQIAYLTHRFEKLQDHEKIVNIMFDEINIQAKLTYKGGHLQGAALNETNEIEPATKVQAFMLSSIFSKHEDVVALYPVKTSTADTLKKWTLEVIKVLTEIGFKIISLICDNYRMNRTMYQLLSGKDILQSYISNPFRPSEYIFLLFDSVHILKSIRNNWLNQKDINQTFIFPSFDDPNLILRAQLQDLKQLYLSEQKKLVKLAPALSQKVLFPSTFERQNVLLACRLFDEKNIVALRHTSTALPFNGAAEFINIILSWWKIVNVHSPKSGYNLRDSLRAPIYTKQDENIKKLTCFCVWLDTWKNLQLPSTSSVPASKAYGKLTSDTFNALMHTTKTLIQIVDYVFKNFKCEYLLLGKFQTDKLEGRFGRYRQLSGNNYNVSVVQLLNTEKKLKIIQLLKFSSSTLGRFTLKSFVDFSNDDIDEDVHMCVLGELSNVVDEAENTIVAEADLPSLFYIAGYVSHALVKFLNNCDFCIRMVTSNECFTVEYTGEVSTYVKHLSRGGLKEPTRLIFEVTTEVYRLFSTLISNDKYEHVFVNSTQQRTILKTLALRRVEDLCENLLEQCGQCTRTIENVISRGIHILCNIFINNYCKTINERKCSETSVKIKARKLKTVN